MKVEFTGPAVLDLEAIADWIARDNPVRAYSFIEELRSACMELGRRPFAYPFVEHHRADGIRRRVHGNYLIFYRVAEGKVEILHVLHGARDYERIIFAADDPD